ncbi:MAG: hypothetical protein KGQ42_08720, partial [Alphaproteobacteria bacterium]|nr:hypothetical protein [Alphaproteobacteria bacterium]
KVTWLVRLPEYLSGACAAVEATPMKSVQANLKNPQRTGHFCFTMAPPLKSKQRIKCLFYCKLSTTVRSMMCSKCTIAHEQQGAQHRYGVTCSFLNPLTHLTEYLTTREIKNDHKSSNDGLPELSFRLCSGMD